MEPFITFYPNTEESKLSQTFKIILCIGLGVTLAFKIHSTRAEDGALGATSVASTSITLVVPPRVELNAEATPTTNLQPGSYITYEVKLPSGTKLIILEPRVD